MTGMQKKVGSGLGALIVVTGFVWIVFDNLALGLIFGLMVAAAAGKAVSSSPAPDEEETRAGEPDPH
jgi:hypothetical protein